MNDPLLELRKRFIEGYGLKLVEHPEITGEILKMMNGRREEWLWVEKWLSEDAPLWANSIDTLVIEIPRGELVDRQAVDFAQGVWMLKPTSFEHQTWGNRTFVRMTWRRRLLSND